MPSKHNPDDAILAVRLNQQTRQRAYDRANTEGDILAQRIRQWITNYADTGDPTTTSNAPQSAPT